MALVGVMTGAGELGVAVVGVTGVEFVFVGIEATGKDVDGGTGGVGAIVGGSVTVPKRKPKPTHSFTNGPSINVGSTSLAGFIFTLRQSNITSR